MKITRETKTALLLIGCITIFIFGFSYLGGKSLLTSEKTIIAFYDEVEGLAVGSKVTISGMTVGKVNQIALASNLKTIKVTMGVRNTLEFSKNSEAILYEAGLIGGKQIAIEPIYEPDNVFQDGDILISSKKPGLTELLNSQIVPLQAKIENMITSADSVLTSVNNILNQSSQKNLRKSITQLTETVENINYITGEISQSMIRNKVSIDETLNNFKNSSESISKLSDSLSQIEFGATFTEFKLVATQLNTILEKMDSDTGTIGKILNDDQFYENLSASTKSLENLLNDLKEHPKRYVHFSLFGRKEKNEIEK